MPIHQLRPTARTRPSTELDEAATAAARRIIRDTSLEDSVANWRAVKRAYLAGYEDARRS